MHLPNRHHQRGELSVQMTPMIDVVFLLLIFFVCTASFQVAEALLPTHLATGSSARQEAVDREPNLEHVLVKGEVEDGKTRWTINQRPCPSLAEVRTVLAATAQIDLSLPVILDVDEDVPLGDMIDVYDLSRQVGFDRIQFAADLRE